ncbi:MAG: hypothetical protein LBR88_01750, partial [Zoogloeaceae bacterium]|nr:hypothetical protein [Zoogloeaceae bacterium]
RRDASANAKKSALIASQYLDQDSSADFSQHELTILDSLSQGYTSEKIAAAMTPPPDGQTFVWQLFAGDPQNAQVQALADTLRHTLPDGHTLRLRADPDLAAIEARLERQTREKK